MMKKFILLTLLFASHAFATGIDLTQNQAANIRITTEQRMAAAAFAGGGHAVNSLTINESGASSDVRVRNVPDATAPNIYPTAPCMGSTAIGGSGVGFGISVGTSWKDDECGIRETARSFQALKLTEDALAVLCSSQYAKSAPSCAGRKEFLNDVR